MRKYKAILFVWFILASAFVIAQDSSDALSSNQDINQLSSQAISVESAFRSAKHTPIPTWAKVAFIPPVAIFLLWLLWLISKNSYAFVIYLLRRNWEPCDAEIIGRGMSFNEKHKRFETFVSFEYQINGEIYPHTIAKTARNYKTAFSQIKKYYIGEYLNVFINPKKPSAATLSNNLEMSVLFIPFYAFVFYTAIFLATYPNKIGDTIYNALFPLSYNIPLIGFPTWVKPLSYMYVFGLIGLKIVYRDKKRSSAFSESTTGIVIKSFVDKKKKPYPIVIYEYEVEGRKYINNAINEKIDNVSYLPFDYAEQYCHKYAKGNEVTVFYDLHEPEVSTLERS